MIGRDTFDIVRPAPGELACCFATLYPSVHREDFVVTEQSRNLLLKFSQNVVVKGPGGQRQRLRLPSKSFDDARVAVTLVDGRIRREEVKVFLPLHVPYFDTLQERGRYGPER